MSDNKKFWYACRNCDWDSVKEYISEGKISVHYQNDYALECACDDKNVPMVEWLLERGADVHGDNLALIHIVRYGNLNLLKLFISKGFDPNANGDKLVWNVAYHGHFEMVKYLFEECVASVPKGSPPQIGGIIGYGLDMIKYLVSKGASPYVDTDMILLAALRGDWDLVDYFLKDQDLFHNCCNSRSAEYVSRFSINAFIRLFHLEPWMVEYIKTDGYASRMMLLVNMMKGTVRVNPHTPDGEGWKDSAYYDSILGMLICSYID